MAFKKAQLQNIMNSATQNLGLLFLLVLIGIIVYEGIIVKQTIATVNSASTPSGEVRSTSVRVNFDAYEKSMRKVQEGESYVPKAEIPQNPFGIESAPKN